MAKIINNKDEFNKEILEATIPAMVDFFATWCGPCKMLSPIIDEVAEEVKDKAIVAKVDSDILGELCVDYTIKLLPTLVFFKDGKEVDRIVGAAEKEEIISKINSLI